MLRQAPSEGVAVGSFGACFNFIPKDAELKKKQKNFTFITIAPP